MDSNNVVIKYLGTLGYNPSTSYYGYIELWKEWYENYVPKFHEYHDQKGELTYMSGCKGMLPTMFDVQPVSRKDRIHQSELPVSLCEQILEFLTYEGEVVLDSFAGSGAVGEAALNLKRNCILIEILKENIQKIKKRFENNILMQTVVEW